MAEERQVLALDLKDLTVRLLRCESGRDFYLKGEGGSHTYHPFWDEVHRRLEPLQEGWAALRESLFETGTAYIDDCGKQQLNLHAQLTPYQVKLHDRLNSLVAHTNLEVVLDTNEAVLR